MKADIICVRGYFKGTKHSEEDFQRKTYSVLGGRCGGLRCLKAGRNLLTVEVVCSILIITQGIGMGCGTAEATGLGFVCFAINPCVLSANRVDFGGFFVCFFVDVTFISLFKTHVISIEVGFGFIFVFVLYNS